MSKLNRASFTARGVSSAGRDKAIAELMPFNADFKSACSRGSSDAECTTFSPLGSIRIVHGGDLGNAGLLSPRDFLYRSKASKQSDPAAAAVHRRYSEEKFNIVDARADEEEEDEGG